MTRASSPVGPLSRRFEASAARERGVRFALEAREAERAALARDCGLPGIDAFAAVFDVAREGTDGLRVTGRVSARIRQVCVVSLDEFASEVVEPVDLLFMPEAEVEARSAARAARLGSADDGEAEDLPDSIIDGRIDLGAVAAEALVLGIDPYPRKPGAAFAEPAPPTAEPEASPFAALRGLKRPDAG